MPQFLAGRFPWAFAALALLTLAADAPLLFDPAFAPAHDTFLNTIQFHYVAAHLWFHGEPPLWFPNVSYGVPTLALTQATLAPADYAAILLGGWTGCRDVLLLQKWAMAFDRVVFLLGLVLLARRLLDRPASVFLVGVVAAGLPVWFSNAAHGFRIFYLFPFALLALHRFAESRRPGYFWAAGLVVLLSLVGNAAYAVGLYAVALTGFFGVWVVRDPGLLGRLFERSAGNLLPLLAFLAAAGFAAATVRTAVAGLEIVTPGRSADGSVGLSDFLFFDGYARGIPLVVWAYGWPVFTEQSLYPGLLPWGLLLWAALYVRKPGFAAVLVPFAALAAVAFSEWVATGFYYGFPLVKYFKPIRYTLGLGLAVFLPLAAGFGLDSLAAADRRRHGAFLLMFVAVSASVGGQTVTAFIDGSVTAHAHLIAGDLPPGVQHWLFLARLTGYAAAVGVGATAAVLSPDPRRAVVVAWALVAALAFDLGLYRVAVSSAVVPVPAGESAVPPVSPMEYLSRRSADYRWRYLPRTPTTIYDAQYQLERIDACLPENRSLLVARGVPELLKARGAPTAGREYYLYTERNRAERAAFPITLRLGDPPLERAVGCAAPKLRVVAAAVGSADPTDAQIKVMPPAQIDETVVLLGPVSDAPPGAASESVRVLDFTANGLTVEAPGPGWLYYADAFHDDWTATVDGQPTAVRRANLAFKAVELGPGSHTVAFRFGGPVRRALHWGLLAVGTAAAAGMVGLIVAAFAGRLGLD